MSDTPKFEVIDRRKYKAEEEERESGQAPAASTVTAEPEKPSELEKAVAGPRLVTSAPDAEPESGAGIGEDLAAEPPLPPPPTAEESQESKSAYDASSQRLEDIVRAQNPGIAVCKVKRCVGRIVPGAAVDDPT